MVQGMIGPDQFEDIGIGSGASSELDNVRFRSLLLSISFKYIFMAHLADPLRLCQKLCT